MIEEHELKKYGYGKIWWVSWKLAIENSSIRAAHITDGWWTRFLQRHPNVSLDATALVRMNAVTEEKLKHYFDLLKQCLEENDLIN